MELNNCYHIFLICISNNSKNKKIKMMLIQEYSHYIVISLLWNLKFRKKVYRVEELKEQANRFQNKWQVS
jgi:hypothetical protein